MVGLKKGDGFERNARSIRRKGVNLGIPPRREEEEIKEEGNGQQALREACNSRACHSEIDSVSEVGIDTKRATSQSREKSDRASSTGTTSRRRSCSSSGVGVGIAITTLGSTTFLEIFRRVLAPFIMVLGGMASPTLTLSIATPKFLETLSIGAFVGFTTLRRNAVNLVTLLEIGRASCRERVSASV